MGLVIHCHEKINIKNITYVKGCISLANEKKMIVWNVMKKETEIRLYLALCKWVNIAYAYDDDVSFTYHLLNQARLLDVVIHRFFDYGSFTLHEGECKFFNQGLLYLRVIKVLGLLMNKNTVNKCLSSKFHWFTKQLVA